MMLNTASAYRVQLLMRKLSWRRPAAVIRLVPRAAIGIRDTPLGVDPSALLETV